MLYTSMILPLQTTAEGLTSEQIGNVVGQLSQSSIELAEAAANFGALKVIFGIFLVFALIMVLLFVYQMLAMTRKVSKIYDTTNKVTRILEESSNRTLGRSQSSILIRRSFNELAQSIKYTILRTRLENHLDQREYVVNKVEKLINHEYQELNSFLMNYECDDRSLAVHINTEDSKIISEFILEQVYLDSSIFTIASMDQAADILIKGLRLEALKGIE